MVFSQEIQYQVQRIRRFQCIIQNSILHLTHVKVLKRLSKRIQLKLKFQFSNLLSLSLNHNLNRSSKFKKRNLINNSINSKIIKIKPSIIQRTVKILKRYNQKKIQRWKWNNLHKRKNKLLKNNRKSSSHNNLIFSQASLLTEK